jgi:hypothetical protein
VRERVFVYVRVKSGTPCSQNFKLNSGMRLGIEILIDKYLLLVTEVVITFQEERNSENTFHVDVDEVRVGGR